MLEFDLIIELLSLIVSIIALAQQLNKKDEEKEQ